MKQRREAITGGLKFAREAQAADQAASEGDFVTAASSFQSLLRHHPNDAKIMDALGRCLLALGRAGDAERLFRKVVAKRPDDLRVIVNLSTSLTMQDKYDEAHRVIDAALKVLPEHPRLLASRAHLLLATDRPDEAVAVIEAALERHPEHINLALNYSVAAKPTGRERQAIAALKRALEAPEIAERQRVTALCALGRLHDAFSECREAMACFVEAGRVMHAQFDPSAFEATVDDMIRFWSPQAIRNMPSVPTADSQRCTFIVGMPRSGTTLIEQILDAHPMVRGLGELNAIESIVNTCMHGFAPGGVPLLLDPEVLDSGALQRWRETYFRVTIRQHGRGLRLIDKAPLNFMHLGLIAGILPAAHIVHCRRDPLDTCFSCYTHDFAGTSFAFTYNLEHLGCVYRCYQKLMEHWQEALDLRFTEVVYEEMVADQEGTTRALLASLDLPWDERCLRFHESDRIAKTSSRDQVRQPIFTTSLNRARRYGDLLQPLVGALAPPR